MRGRGCNKWDRWKHQCGGCPVTQNRWRGSSCVIVGTDGKDVESERSNGIKEKESYVSLWYIVERIMPGYRMVMEISVGSALESPGERGAPATVLPALDIPDFSHYKHRHMTPILQMVWKTIPESAGKAWVTILLENNWNQVLGAIEKSSPWYLVEFLGNWLKMVFDVTQGPCDIMCNSKEVWNNPNHQQFEIYIYHICLHCWWQTLWGLSRWYIHGYSIMWLLILHF